MIFFDTGGEGAGGLGQNMILYDEGGGVGVHLVLLTEYYRMFDNQTLPIKGRWNTAKLLHFNIF